MTFIRHFRHHVMMLIVSVQVFIAMKKAVISTAFSYGS